MLAIQVSLAHIYIYIVRLFTLTAKAQQPDALDGAVRLKGLFTKGAFYINDLLSIWKPDLRR